EDSALGVAVLDQLAELACLVGVVDPNLVGFDAEVEGFMAERVELRQNGVAQTHAAVIESDCNPHNRYVTPDGRSGTLGRTGAAIPCRFGALRGSGEVRPPDVRDVRRRPDGGAAREVLPLRLRQPEGPGQRPTRLLEGARLDAAVRDVQGGGSHLRRGAADV